VAASSPSHAVDDRTPATLPSRKRGLLSSAKTPNTRWTKNRGREGSSSRVGELPGFFPAHEVLFGRWTNRRAPAVDARHQRRELTEWTWTYTRPVFPSSTSGFEHVDLVVARAGDRRQRISAREFTPIPGELADVGGGVVGVFPRSATRPDGMTAGP